VYNGEEYHELKTAKNVVDFFRDKDCVVYAHNGGKFDWHFIIEHLENNEPLKIIHGRLASFKIGAAEYRDSFNLLPMPLAAYKKDDINYSIFEESERDKPKNRDAIRKYLKADCVYLYELLADFKRDYGNGLTLAGSALAYWSKKFKVKRPKSSAWFFSETRRYYYGGRCQAIKPGLHTGKFKLYDINSAYPEAMLHPHPWGDEYRVSKSLPDDRADWGRCFITLSAAATGAFPKRSTKNNELLFPDDQSIQTFDITGWEYLAALDTKTLGAHEINRVVEFKQSLGFGDYVNHFYDIKKNAPKGSTAYIFSKLFMNSLYGKFASNPSTYRDYQTIDPSEIEIYKKEGWSFTSLIGAVAIMEKPVPENQQRYLNVATGASITGYVRAKLWRAICSAKNPIYCDTDSIVCAAADLEIGKELGQWNLEFAFDKAAIAGKKLYAFWDTQTLDETAKPPVGLKMAHKGVKLNRKEIIDVVNGKTVTYDRDAPTFGIKPKADPFVSRKVKRKQQVKT